MGKNKKSIKYTVRAVAAGLYTLLLVVGYQNCSLYQSKIDTGKGGGTSQNPGDDGDNNNNGTSRSNCQIISLSDGGTKTVPNHTFSWIVTEPDCIVEAKLNNGSWQVCDSQNAYGCKVSFILQHNFSIDQYGTHTLDVRTYTSEGNILDLGQATVTIQRPLNCESYQECEQSRTNRFQTHCTCEPSNNNGHTCYSLSCNGNPIDDEGPTER